MKLQNALEFVREGDVFIVTRLDRCARSTLDLLKISEILEKKKVEMKATHQEKVTTSYFGCMT